MTEKKRTDLQNVEQRLKVIDGSAIELAALSAAMASA
jgi:hypothetical protein